MKKCLGIPYRWGGSSKKGMDCSGLTKYIYSELLGIDLPHNSTKQSRMKELEDISPFKDKLKTGDLLFFGPKRKNVNHVGIYMSDGKFIHASRRSGVNIASLSGSYWKNRLITGKRLKNASSATHSGDFGLPGMRDLLALSGSSPLERSMQTVELGYASPLLNSINLNVDTFLQLRPRADEHNLRKNLQSWDQRNSDTSLAMEFRQGFRLFTDLTPFNWLTITPSYSRMKDQGLFSDRTEEPIDVLGLDALLKPRSARWSFTMSARTWDQKNLAIWPSGIYQDVNSLEVGVGLGLHLSKSFSLSLVGMGKYSNYEDMRNVAEGDERLSPFIRNVAFKVDFSF